MMVVVGVAGVNHRYRGGACVVVVVAGVMVAVVVSVVVVAVSVVVVVVLVRCGGVCKCG